MMIPLVRRWFTASGGLVAEVDPAVDAADVFPRLARLPHAIFFDSALPDSPPADSAARDAPPPRLGRHSFVAADPIHSVQVSTDVDDPTAALAAALDSVRGMLDELAGPTIPGLPPFQGGVAGLLSYECGLARLGLVPPPSRACSAPFLSLHVYDVVFAFDHDAGRGWVISQGVPAKGPRARRARALERMEAMLARLENPPAGVQSFHAGRSPACRVPPEPASPPPSFPYPLPAHRHVRATHSRDAYLRMVEAGIEAIRAGDIFQVNLAQHFSVEAAIDPVSLALASRSSNPAPFAASLDTGAETIVSASPERFLQVTRGTVRMHPIKGTRRVIASPEADLFAGDDLGASDKDRAENVMIVDLIRNDLARVCRPESVRVERLCRLERYRYVQHLVSIVAGRLREGLQALDAVEAGIPGGSITGAPKHRACEIISDLEKIARGAYCGSLGYIGFDGTADFNLLIRTFVVARDRVTFAAGGGITVRSDPAAEYEETLHKAEGMLRALDATAGGSARPAPREPSP
jgi:para-aminobenzoate synthetase component 1